MTRPTFEEEVSLWNQGFEYVIGADEVGRGAFAGPVVAAAVIFPVNFHTVLAQDKSIRFLLRRLNDSKLVRPQMRQKLAACIKTHCRLYAIGQSAVETINTVGVGKATTQAIHGAITALLMKLPRSAVAKTFVLIDGYKIATCDPLHTTQWKGIIKGDRKCSTIAAASIIAKVYRDALMDQLHNQYPMYNFLQNKGYGTTFHRNCLREYGMSDVHRTSFDLNPYLSNSESEISPLQNTEH